MNDYNGDEIPDEVAEYYRQVEREVLEETIRQDPVRSEVKLSTFVSASKGRNRKRRSLKEITLIKYGHNYHEPHRFDWWVAGLELIGDDPDCDDKLREIVLGNQARDLNNLKTKLRRMSL